MADDEGQPKPKGKALGEHGEAGDEVFQNDRLDAIEAHLVAQGTGFVPAERRTPDPE